MRLTQQVSLASIFNDPAGQIRNQPGERNRLPSGTILYCWKGHPQRGGRGQPATIAVAQQRTPAERHAAMTWAQRLGRVLGIDIETCPACCEPMRIIACIEDPGVVEKRLDHFDVKAPEPEGTRWPACRVPPQRGLFEESG